MKLISPIKFLTAVGFLLVTGFTASGLAQEKDETKGTCYKKCENKKTEFSEACTVKNKKLIADGFKADADTHRDCVKDLISDCKIDNNCDDKDTAQSRKQECTSAMDKYKTAVKEASGACDSFEKVPGSKNSCEARINACRKKINNGISSGAGTDDLAKTMMSIYVQQNFPNANSNDFPTDTGTTGPSCTNYKSKEDRKEKKNDQKEIDKDIAKLKKEINDEKKKITEENAKLRKDNAEIESDQQKVDKEVKKALDKVDKETGDRLRKLNEELANKAIAVRKTNEVIVKAKEEIERIKFENAQEMMQFTQDKISTQCQSAIDTAKQCFIMSSKVQSSNDPKNPCAGYTISAKGAKGTAQLKSKIAKVKDACFENASMAVNKSRFKLGTNLRTNEMLILSKNNEITDAKNDIERRQNDYTSITAESEKEKSTEQKDAEIQIENLKNKLDSLTKSTQEAIQHSNEKMLQFTNEINDLNTKKLAAKMGVLESEEMDNSLNDATALISNRESERKSALSVCCIEGKDAVDPEKSYKSTDIKNMKPICQQLAIGGTNQVDDKGRTTTSSAK